MTIQDQITALRTKVASLKSSDSPVVSEIRSLLQKAAYLAPLNEQAAQRHLDMIAQKIGV